MTKKEHYTITLQDGGHQWLLHFDSYFKWIISTLLLRVVVRFCLEMPTPQQKRENQDEFPEQNEKCKSRIQ